MKLVVANPEAVEGAKRTIIRRVSADWRRHRTLARYFEENLGRRWDGRDGNIGLRDCDHRFIQRGRDYPKSAIKVISLPCRQRPFCFRCNERETNLRVHRTFDALWACKPAAKPPLMFHMVQTAPLVFPSLDDYERRQRLQPGTLAAEGWPEPTEPEGWAVHASRDIDAFFQVIWRSCLDFFGEGIGGKFSYQHFGSKGPHKTHPHIDFTMNGWRLLDGKAIPLKLPDLRRGDLQRWQRIVMDHSREMGGPFYSNPGHVFFGQRFDNIPGYYPILSYQLRELWEFDSVSYPAPKTLRWHSYKGGWHDYAEGDLYRHMMDYQKQFGKWGGGQAATLHRLFGHMAKGQVAKTMAAIGGVKRPHKKFCVCNICQDWYPIIANRRPGDASRDADPVP